MITKQPNWKESVLVVVKAGDQLGTGGYRDGEIVDYIDSDMWGKAPVISDHMKTVYRLEMRSRKQLEDIKNAIAKNAQYHDDKKTDRVLLNTSDAIYKDVKSDWIIKNKVVEIVDATKLKLFSVTDTVLKKVLIDTDANAITAGSYTVGSGGDYTTWASAFADVGNLTGDLTLTRISSTAETVRALVNSKSLNGYKFTCTSDTDFLGDQTIADVTTFAQTNQGLYIIMSGTGTVIVELLYFKRVTSSTSELLRIDLSTAGSTYHVRNNMFNNNDLGTRMYYANSANATQNIYNNVFWKNKTVDYPVTLNGVVNFINNSFTDLDGQGLNVNNTASVCTNNVMTDVHYPNYNAIGSATGNNNAGDDTSNADASWSSGSGNVTSVGSVFDSTDDTSTDFLRPTVAGALDGANTTSPISGHTTLINGASINAIGAYGILSTLSGTKSRFGEVLGIKRNLLGTDSRFGEVLGIKRGII